MFLSAREEELANGEPAIEVLAVDVTETPSESSASQFWKTHFENCRLK
jgi:hypothetical protein